MEKETIVSPVDGEIIELENILDEVFSSGILGDGFGVIPTSKNFYSPVNGKVENAYKTGHAYTIVTDDGLEVLIHIGIDTVELEGEFFDSKISQGEHLKKGDIIAHVDTDRIMERGFDPVCVVVVANSDKLHNIDIKCGQCYSGDVAMEYEQK